MLEGFVIFNDFIMNRQDIMRGGFKNDPYYWVDVRSIDGFWEAEISDETHSIPQGIGTVSRDSFTRLRTITPSGFIEAGNMSMLGDCQRFLQNHVRDWSIHKLQFVIMD